MQLSIKAFALSFGLIWGGGIAVTALLHLAIPSYGSAFLGFLSSIYPGFHGARSLPDALVGTAYGLLDGGVGGAIFASLYNLIVSRLGSSAIQH